MTVIDLYAGPGGWDIAARALGIDVVGIELDTNTCATRAFAGHTTIRADVLDCRLPPGTKIDGLIASPPCQAFSDAGTKDAVPEIESLVDMIQSQQPPYIETGHLSRDARMVLAVAEWIDAYEPEWVALEQVRAVQPVWDAIATWLFDRGWVSAETWTLTPADYGVPQYPRWRAVLIAHRTRSIRRPPATHLAPPEQEPLFPPELPSWMTMAEALGCPVEVNIGRDWKPGGTRDDAQIIDGTTRPAPTLSAKAGGQWQLKSNSRGPQSTTRRIDQPSQTLAFGKAANDWVWERPATTVTTDPRLWPPGHKINQDDIDRLGQAEAEARYGDRRGTDAIRLTINQAARLQTFPDGYPWQGSKTSQFTQCGNAVPPLLALHLLAEVAK